MPRELIVDLYFQVCKEVEKGRRTIVENHILVDPAPANMQEQPQYNLEMPDAETRVMSYL